VVVVVVAQLMSAGRVAAQVMVGAAVVAVVPQEQLMAPLLSPVVMAVTGMA
jgi:hypothetical protein